MSWKICTSSLQGTSHAASGLPCQDSNKCKRIQARFGEYIILVASDGCGSAKYAEIGSKIVVSEVTDCLGYWLKSSVVIPDLAELIALAFGHAHKCLIHKADTLLVTPNELAATCMCVVIGPDRFAAAQIGDGVIIVHSNGVCGCLFWPIQEYANVTHTLTGRDWRANTQTINAFSDCNMPDGWFLATDGIQAISCDYEKRVPISGFVSVLIEKFRRISNPTKESMQKVLEALLMSNRVSSAVSDDKTIILAFR